MTPQDIEEDRIEHQSEHEPIQVEGPSVRFAAECLGCEASGAAVELALTRVEILRRDLNATEGEDLLAAAWKDRPVSVRVAAEFLGCEASGPAVDVALARVEILRQELKAKEGEDVLAAWDRIQKEKGGK